MSDNKLCNGDPIPAAEGVEHEGAHGDGGSQRKLQLAERLKGAAEAMSKARGRSAVVKTAANAGKAVKKTTATAGEVVKKTRINAGEAMKKTTANASSLFLGKKRSSSTNDNDDENDGDYDYDDNKKDNEQEMEGEEQANMQEEDEQSSDDKEDYQSARSNSFAKDTATPTTSASGVAQSDSQALSFLMSVSHDTTSIVILVVAIIAKLVSIRNYKLILNNQIPFHVSCMWAILTFFIGRKVERHKALTERKAEESSKSGSAPRISDDQDERHITRSRDAEKENDRKQQTAFPRFKEIVDRVRFHRKNAESEKAPSLRFWTTLGEDPNRKRQPWERFGNVLVSKSLTNALLSKKSIRQRASLKELGVSVKDIQQAVEEDKDLFLGTYANVPEKLRASSLEEECVNPLFRLRGLDVFLADCPETSMGTHSYLIQNGLRDRPTFLVNGMTQWANVCIYFEMPEWVTDWKHFEEGENDPEDIIAFKRFLNGTDEYRNKRFKAMPFLVDGPGPIKFMAPRTKSTATIVGQTAKGNWIKHPCQVDEKTGKTLLHPCLEFECDMMASATIRSITSLFKRYLRTVVGDAAMLIEKPYLQEEDEPSAVLGMCRFDRIDVRTCPDMPPRLEYGETEEERDMKRASVVLGAPALITCP